jgi:hypothetical protein
MYNFIQKFHSGWAYLVLILLLITVIISLVGYFNKKQFSPTDRKIALFALIASHIQLLIGLTLYFVSPNGLRIIQQLGMGGLDTSARLLALEHPFTNLIAIILITIGWSKHKRQINSVSKYKTFSIFYGLGLLLILSRVPWHLWF